MPILRRKAESSEVLTPQCDSADSETTIGGTETSERERCEIVNRRTRTAISLNTFFGDLMREFSSRLVTRTNSTRLKVVKTDSVRTMLNSAAGQLSRHCHDNRWLKTGVEKHFCQKEAISQSCFNYFCK